MMNNNYKIFGLITSLLRSDNPPKISKNFSENVMKDISLDKISSHNNYNNYLNIAASVFFAVITAYSLISYDRLETNVVSADVLQDTIDNNNGLIRRVIDDSDCDYDKNNNEKNNENCK